MRSLRFLLAIFPLFLFSCYKEQIIDPEFSDKAEAFNFQLTDYQEQQIYDSRGVRLSFSDTLPVLEYHDDVYGLDGFEVRGETSLYYRRKGFSVNFDDNLFLYVEREGRIREFEKLKMAALVFDYTYIENFIAIEFFKEVGLWPLHSFYNEVMLNNHTQGIYLIIEDVEDYFMYEQGSDFVMRRAYHHNVDHYDLNDRIPVESADHYLARFDSVYSFITKYSGKQLYDSLMHLVDMRQYFVKISMDMLLMNGDYTDEIFFYIKEIDGKKIFGVCPWDYDDIFQDQPHEIGRDWAVGQLFGTRTYASMDDVIADAGEKLIFSIEDDLDYKIATDTYLYQQYLPVLEQVLHSIDDQVIENAFAAAKTVLQPFYDKIQIVEQSNYDVNATNQNLFDSNLAGKKQLLLNRRQWILNELPNHLN
ncbi:MAG: CotH kinase family protein [Bacteroidales bacterium]|jgi:hypothetical protein